MVFSILSTLYKALRCKKEGDQTVNYACQEIGSMTTLEIKQEVEDVQKRLKALSSLASDIHKQSELNQKKMHLERQFNDVSDESEMADELTRLLRLADEVKEFTQKNKFYQLSQVLSVAINEIKEFHERFYEAVPESVFETLNTGATALRKSSDLMLKAVERLQCIESLNEKTPVKKLRIWAVNLEVLAEELENNLPFLSAEVFNSLETLCETIVLRSRKRSEEATTKREGYRRRIRFAAGFILNLVEEAEEEAVREDEEVFRDMELLGRKTLNAIYCEGNEEWD